MFRRIPTEPHFNFNFIGLSHNIVNLIFTNNPNNLVIIRDSIFNVKWVI